MTPRRGAARRRSRLRLRVIALLAGAVVFASACTVATEQNQPVEETLGSGGGTSAPAPPSVSATAEAPASDDAPTTSAGAGPATASTGPAMPDTAAVATSVEAALRALAEEQETVTRDQVRSAIERGFTDAGVEAETLEVSIDQTPTGLDIDAIQGSGLIAEECVIGEIREGSVSVTVLPVLGTGLCFVGDQR